MFYSFILNIKIIYLFKTQQYTNTASVVTTNQEPRTTATITATNYNHNHRSSNKFQIQKPQQKRGRKKKLKTFNKTPPYTAQPATTNKNPPAATTTQYYFLKYPQNQHKTNPKKKSFKRTNSPIITITWNPQSKEKKEKKEEGNQN